MTRLDDQGLEVVVQASGVRWETHSEHGSSSSLAQAPLQRDTRLGGGVYQYGRAREGDRGQGGLAGGA